MSNGAEKYQKKSPVENIIVFQELQAFYTVLTIWPGTILVCKLRVIEYNGDIETCERNYCVVNECRTFWWASPVRVLVYHQSVMLSVCLCVCVCRLTMLKYTGDTARQTHRQTDRSVCWWMSVDTTCLSVCRYGHSSVITYVWQSVCWFSP